MSKYVLVLTITGSVCEEDEGRECVTGVVEVEGRDQAREVRSRLNEAGYTVHFVQVQPLNDYL